MHSSAGRNRRRNRMIAGTAGIAAGASLLAWFSLPTANAATPTTLAAVLAASGANLDTNYPIPTAAVFVAPNGSDSAVGSQSAPLATVQAAITKASAGGTIVFRGGTYRQGNAVANKSLSFQAYPHEKPVLLGSDVVTAWTQSGNAWLATSWTSPFSQTAYFAHAVGAGSSAGKDEQVFRNDESLVQVLERSDLGSGKFWVDPSSLQLYVADDPTGASMELTNRLRALTINAANSKVLGLRFSRYGIGNLDDTGMLAIHGAGATIENDWFDHSSGAGLGVSGANLTVDHITTTDNAGAGMGGNRNHNSVVQYSQFIRNNSDHFLMNGCQEACTMAGFKTAHTDNLKILDNAFVDNDANGYWCDLGCSNGTITGNAVSGAYDGIMWEVSSKALISDNYVENADKGIRISGSDHATITNNTLVNNNFQFTIYDDKRSSSTDAYAAGLGQSWNVTDLIVTGNTVIGGPKTTKLWVTSSSDADPATRQLADVSRNRVSGNQDMLWCAVPGQCKSYPTIQQWSAVSGQPFGTWSATDLSAPGDATTHPPTTIATTPSVTIAPTSPATPIDPPVVIQGSKPSPSSATLLSTGFESPTRWNPFGSVTVIANSDKKHSGTSSIVVRSLSTSPAIAGATASPNPIVATVAGKTYTGTCWVKSHTQINVRGRFQEYDNNWVRLADPVVGPPTRTVIPSYWYKVSVSHKADREGVQLPFSVYSADLSTATEPLYIDDCTVTVS